MKKALEIKIEDFKIKEAAEEIKAIFVESEFNARMVIIEAYHQVGTLIVELGGDRADVVQRLAQRVGRSKRMLWYAVKFAEKFSRVEDIKEGKNISMNMIIHKYLTTPKEQAEHVHEFITICKICHEPLNPETAKERAIA